MTLIDNYDHIIWDWNGTLLDDVWLCVEIVNAMLSARDLPGISNERYGEIFDFPVKQYYRRAGFDFSLEPFEQLAAEYISKYDRRQRECSLSAGSMEVLQYCRSNNIGQSVLSASHQERLENTLQGYNINHFFDTVSGLGNVYAESKLDNGRKLVDKLDTDSVKVILVGDTVHDFEVAESLGIYCALIDGGHHSRSKIETTSATVRNTLTDLIT